MKSTICPHPNLLAAIFLLSASLSSARAASSVPDTYAGTNLTVVWTRADSSYSGTISLGSQEFPLKGTAGGDGIKGTFTSGGNVFPFVATLDGDTLTLNTGGAKYVLKKQSAVNPLAAQNPPAPANPLAAASAPDADALAGYTTVSSTDSGKALSTEKAGATTVQAALQATLPDLSRYFAAKPTIGSAYQDAKDPKSGGATFSDSLNGQPVKGIISCKLNDNGASVAVIYARADASKAEWEKLESPSAASTSPPSAAAAPPAPSFPLHEFDFPDGSGSLELADGWTTTAQTCINPVVILGPAKQNIVLNNRILIETPDSPTQKMMQRNKAMIEQMAANARAAGRPAPPPFPAFPPSLVSPYLEPLEAVKQLTPQLSKISEFHHGPSTTLDEILSVKDAPCFTPTGKGALIAYTYTQTTDGQAEQFRRGVYLQTYPMNAGTWVWLLTGVTAPAATFEKDRDLMFAMENSLRVNQAQFTQNLNAQTQTNIHDIQVLGQAENQVLNTQAQMGRDNMNTQNSIYQQQHQAQMDGYAQHNAQWAADETQKQRNAADFIETIQGTRMVYDTQTGTSGYANLSDVTGVVDALNQAALDPNRFVQVPLRDYLYAPTPVPGR